MKRHKAMIASSIAPALALALALAACGGGGSQSDAASSASPVALAPAPGPTSTPTPAPTPTPFVHPLAARLGSDRLLNILQPGDGFNGGLLGIQVCASGNFTYARDANGTQRLAGVNDITGVEFGSLFQLFADRSGSLSVDVWGPGIGGAFSETNRVSPPTPRMRAYRTATHELQVFDNSLFATAGLLSDGQGICFFAAGPEGVTAFIPFEPDVANIDGIAIVGGRARRLLDSRIADWRADPATNSVIFTIVFVGASPAFSETQSDTSNLGRVQVRFGRTTGRFEALAGDLRVAPESTVGCVNYFGDDGLGCIFNLRLENGDRLFGALSVDASQRR